MPTTKDKLEFTWAMARHTQATVRQCEALMRYAGTLQRLAKDQCNREWTERDQAKRDRMKAKVTELCTAITGFTGKDSDTCSCGVLIKVHRSWRHPPQPIAQTSTCAPVLFCDPRGCVLKIRVPDGFVNDAANEGIVVPS
jgi:hypothetical protein